MAGQQFNQTDQRQADQRIGIAAFQSLKQHYAQPLTLEATGAIEGLLGLDITTDCRLIEGAEMHGEGFDQAVTLARGRIDHRQARIEGDTSALGRQQLRHGALDSAGFTEDLVLADTYLIRAYDQTLIMQIGDGLCLGDGQSQHQLLG